MEKIIVNDREIEIPTYTFEECMRILNYFLKKFIKEERDIAKIKKFEELINWFERMYKTSPFKRLLLSQATKKLFLLEIDDTYEDAGYNGTLLVFDLLDESISYLNEIKDTRYQDLFLSFILLDDSTPCLTKIKDRF